jgi:hypothetical protein
MHDIYNRNMWPCGCLFRKTDELDKNTHHTNVGWFYPCLICDMKTSNMVSYLVLIRSDYDMFSVPMCNRCKQKDDVFNTINDIRYNVHRSIRISTLSNGTSV